MGTAGMANEAFLAGERLSRWWWRQRAQSSCMYVELDVEIAKRDSFLHVI